jgi:uncharacterized glyoxalase superfamily protein PhnB
MNQQDQFIPHLIVSDGLAALEFYKATFGATEGDRMMAPDGKRLMHGEVVLDGAKAAVVNRQRRSAEHPFALRLSSTMPTALLRAQSQAERVC